MHKSEFGYDPSALQHWNLKSLTGLLYLLEERMFGARRIACI